MSCYIVQNETINDSIRFLYSIMNNGYQVAEPLASLGYRLDNIEDRKRLAQDMFKLNIDSYNARYEDNDENISLDDFEFIDGFSDFKRNNASQCFKSLQCFLYQSCEGDCENTDLYKAIEEVKANLACLIVQNLQEYNSAQWG